MNKKNYEFTLRQAIAADLNFIWQLRLTTMKNIISASYGWDESTQRQYAAESLQGNIVLVEGDRAGVITLSDWQDQLHLTFMSLLPQYQGLGLGSRLIEYAKKRAVNQNRPLTLQVLKIHPARLFYERHGFKVYERNGTHKLLMRWKPTTNYQLM